jgi:uncharacterized protein (DUF1778 family)
METAMATSTKATREQHTRAERLGFRIDERTKALIERAAQLERRKLTDFCVTALADAARRTIAEHDTLVLSERDRRAFFEALIDPPEPNDRLRRAFAEHKRRVTS